MYSCTIHSTRHTESRHCRAQRNSRHHDTKLFTNDKLPPEPRPGDTHTQSAYTTDTYFAELRLFNTE